MSEADWVVEGEGDVVWLPESEWEGLLLGVAAVDGVEVRVCGSEEVAVGEREVVWVGVRAGVEDRDRD